MYQVPFPMNDTSTLRILEVNLRVPKDDQYPRIEDT